jgi:hypothetical protein
LRNVATRKGRFREKTLWLRMAGENGSDGRCGKAWQVSFAEAVAVKSAKPFGADRAIGVDLNCNPPIACRVVEVNRYIALCGHPNANAKRAVAVVKE